MDKNRKVPFLNKSNRLGKGLDSLLSVPVGSARILSLDIDKISPNPNQPRKDFETEALSELAHSIKEHGVLQPILVKTKGDAYEIIAGERRWRASQKAGLHKIPSIIKSPEETEQALWALLENLQRKDLNSIEEAQAYKHIFLKNPKLTHEKLAETLGKSRSSLSNVLRLLQLDPEIQKWIAEGRISLGQAKELLSIDNKVSRKQVASTLLTKKTSVKALSRKIKNPGKKKPPWQESLKEKLEKKFQTEVRFDFNKKKGKLSFLFSGEEGLKRLLDKL